MNPTVSDVITIFPIFPDNFPPCSSLQPSPAKNFHRPATLSQRGLAHFSVTTHLVPFQNADKIRRPLPAVHFVPLTIGLPTLLATLPSRLMTPGPPDEELA